MWCLLFLFACIEVYGSNNLLFPIQKSAPFPLHKEYLSCDLPFPHLDINSYVTHEISTKIPIKQDPVIDGYLCSSELWVAECVEGFLGGQDKKFKTQTSPITKEACLSALDQYLKGTYRQPVKPDYKCLWYASNSNSVNYIVIKHHQVAIDHYSMEYKDLVFSHGKCSEKICDTVYDSMVWIPKDHSAPNCPNVEFGKITLYHEKNRISPLYVSSDSIPYENLQGSCQGLQYCGDSYILTPFGQGFSFHGFTNGTFAEAEYLRSLPICSQTRMISVNTGLRMSEITLKLEETMRIERCEDSLEKIRNDKNVTKRDLYRLSPVRPGLGYAFSLVNGSIHLVKADYLLTYSGNVTCDFLNNTCTYTYKSFGGTVNQMKITCNDPFIAQSRHICEHLNGLTLIEGSIITPDRGYLNREVQDIMLLEHEVNYEQHIMLTPEQKQTLSISEHSVGGKRGDVWEEFRTEAKDWISHVIIALGVLVPFILVISCWVVQMKRKGFCSSPKKKDEGIPMEILHSASPVRRVNPT